MHIRVLPAIFRLSVLAILSVASTSARAKEAPLLLQQAVTQATDRYPSVRAAATQVSAASASAALAVRADGDAGRGCTETSRCVCACAWCRGTNRAAMERFFSLPWMTPLENRQCDSAD